MATVVQEQSHQRKSAFTAGISLVIMALAAFFSYGLVLGSLVVQDDPSATFQNIMLSSTLFRAGILGWLIILICDIVAAWSFYLFLKPLNKNLSLLAAWLRLTYTGILGIAILNLVFVSILMDSTASSSLFNINQLQEYVRVLLEAFHIIWSIGLIIFGGHLMIVGYLAFQSGFIPKAVSILLLIASSSYMLVHFCYAFLPQYDGIISMLESILSVPMSLGELSFGLWLLFKGGKAFKSV